MVRTSQANVIDHCLSKNVFEVKIDLSVPLCYPFLALLVGDMFFFPRKKSRDQCLFSVASPSYKLQLLVEALSGFKFFFVIFRK